MTSRRERYDAWRAGFLAGQRAARGDEAAAGAAPFHDDGYDSFEDEWMTKTNAKQVYHLNEADLRKLPVQRKPNPVDGRFAPMCLYKVAHLQARVARDLCGAVCVRARCCGAVCARSSCSC